MNTCPATAEDVLTFWFEPEHAQKWFVTDAGFDAEIKTRFSKMLEAVCQGLCSELTKAPRGTLALVIVLDQFSRNIYRGTAEAFAQDEKARLMARQAIARGFDMQLPENERRWFYMPFMHSENLEDQRLCVELFEERLENPEAAVFARDHLEVISRFGRFPHRNAVLGRVSTAAEREYLKTSSGWGQGGA